MEFISVNEKLPEHNQTVEVKGKFPFTGMQCIFQKMDEGYQFVYMRKGIPMATIYGITHWKTIEEKEN